MGVRQQYPQIIWHIDIKTVISVRAGLLVELRFDRFHTTVFVTHAWQKNELPVAAYAMFEVQQPLFEKSFPEGFTLGLKDPDTPDHHSSSRISFGAPAKSTSASASMKWSFPGRIRL